MSGKKNILVVYSGRSYEETKDKQIVGFKKKKDINKGDYLFIYIKWTFALFNSPQEPSKPILNAI